MQQIEVDGAVVSYQVDGAGPALVLVSGTGGNLNSNWDHLIPALSARHQVLRADYAGSSGGTRDPQQKLNVERLAGQVMAAVDAAGIERFHLAGYSLGTSIAIHIAAHHPQRVRRMVPPMHARALADAIPNAHYAELASGHLAPFEQAEAYARLLLDFLAQEE